MCVLKCVRLFFFFFFLFLHRISIQSGFMQSYNKVWHLNSTFFSPLLFQKRGNKYSKQPVRTYAACRDEDNKRSSVRTLPWRLNHINLAYPGHDHTEQEEKRIHEKKKVTVNFESTQVQYRHAFFRESIKKSAIYVQKSPLKRIEREALLYKTSVGEERSAGPVWSPPINKRNHLNPDRGAA